jgi:hypothetical protein
MQNGDREEEAMLYPDEDTKRLLVREHQAELRRQAQRPDRDHEADRPATVAASSGHVDGPTARDWIRWLRRDARRPATQAQ